MKFSMKFVNQVIGTASGFRDVALNNVHDEAGFEVAEKDALDFPLATLTREKSKRGAVFKTFWHDGDHWMAFGKSDDLLFDPSRLSEMLGLETTVAFPQHSAQEVFALGTEFRSVVETFRPQIVAAIQSKLDQNVALVDGLVMARCLEPHYRLRIENHDPAGGKAGEAVRTLDASFRAPTFLQERFPSGHCYRADDIHALRSDVEAMMHQGYSLKRAGDGVFWNVDEIEVMILESIQLDAERQTLTERLASVRLRARSHLKYLTYEQMESYCALREALETADGLASDEALVAAVGDGLKLEQFDSFRNSSVCLVRAFERWENRTIDAVFSYQISP